MAAISRPPTCCRTCRAYCTPVPLIAFWARLTQAARTFFLCARASPCTPVPAPVSCATSTPSKSAPIQLADEVLPIQSEEHTSELQSRPHLVCRLLLEKKNS